MEFGFRTSFNFIPERYKVSQQLRDWLSDMGFEVGVHDLNHDGSLFNSRSSFLKRAPEINWYLKQWKAQGFRAGAMYHDLDWIAELDVLYDSSTFDTDPFEPQKDGVGKIFPFLVQRNNGTAFAELPYTLAQDFTLFLLMKENTIDLWKLKLDWIAEHHGMALIDVHPDYLDFGRTDGKVTYPVRLYREFLEYCVKRYGQDYWAALPREVANYLLDQHGRGPRNHEGV
jgi:hypothetical protein